MLLRTLPIKFGNGRVNFTSVFSNLKKLHKDNPRNDVIRLTSDPASLGCLLAEGLKSQLPTIGNGVQIKKSTHLKSIGIKGFGLFAARPFSRGEIITYYYGRLVKVPMGGAEKINPSQLTHAKSVLTKQYMIIGNEMMPKTKQDDQADRIVKLDGKTKKELKVIMQGLGGGAFINDYRKNVTTNDNSDEGLNCAYEDYNFNTISNAYQQNPHFNVVLIVATKNIPKGQEILIDYGDSYSWDLIHGTNNNSTSDSGSSNTNYASLTTVFPDDNRFTPGPKVRFPNLQYTKRQYTEEKYADEEESSSSEGDSRDELGDDDEVSINENDDLPPKKLEKTSKYKKYEPEDDYEEEYEDEDDGSDESDRSDGSNSDASSSDEYGSVYGWKDNPKDKDFVNKDNDSDTD